MADMVVTADDSARVRDLLASHRTLLAWLRTSLAFAGLGFGVARFGLKPNLSPDEVRTSADLGIVFVGVAVLLTLVGYAQHVMLLKEELAPPGAPQPARWPGVVATICVLVICAIMIPYLAVVG